MKTIALNRLNILGIAKGNGWTEKQQLVFLAELAKLGYRITNPDLLKQASSAFLLDYQHLLQTLAKKRGGNVQYVPLFKNFPNDVPEENAYFLKRIVGYIGNLLDLFPDAVVLQNGVKVPKWLFNTAEFGADPITQMQSAELFEAAVKENALKQGDSHVEWLDLTIAFDEDLEKNLQDYLKRLVYSKASIKEELHGDLYRMLDFFGAANLDVDLVVFKETKSLLMKYFWQKGDLETLSKFAQSATDVLRLFAAVTGTDVSLSDKVKFPKMSRKARKAILNILENSSTLSDDIKKYKGLWLEIGRYLHPAEYATQYPETAAVFDALRNGKIETYNSKTEKLLALKELDTLLAHLESKPGVYGRKLHEVVRRFPDQLDKILASFEKNIAKIPLKNLLVLKPYFATINEEANRSVINKKGKMIVLENNAFGALNNSHLEKITALIQKAILRQLSERESWENKKVWIDASLSNYTLPLQQRKASDGIITVGKGSRIKVDFDKVLRLFVYWKEAKSRTDLDLSVIEFDADFQYLGHVSYTRLAGEGIVHSGDIQSAPQGAAEFIDITLSAVGEATKYLAIQVYRFAGDAFADMDCHAGWMLRTNTDASLATFDIKTVANKFDLNGKGAYAIPLMVDIEKQEIISTDMYVNSLDFYNNVEGSLTDITAMCSELAKFTQTRPVLSDLAVAHANARKATIVENKEEAEISFGVKDCTYNATDIELILSELI